MRNLKRALSLGLASSMVLSTTAFSASAAMAKGEYPEMGLTGYTDHDQFSSDTNESQNAAFIAKQIDLMSGQEDGSFGVNDTLSRWQMAVIVTRMYFGDNFDVTTYPTTNADGSPVFNDLDGVVTEDIKRFIFAACDTGLIAGVGNGNFNPNGQVTLADALVMVLKAVGYLNINDKEWTTANNYQTFVTSLAYNLGLIDKSYVGNNAGLNEAMTREEIVVLVVRALTDIAAVSYNQAEQKYYNTFGLMNGTDDTIDNTDTYATLGFDRFKLEKHDVYDPFGRPSVTWIKDGYVLSNFVEEAVFETAEPVSVSTLYDYLGAVMNKYTAENFHYKIVVDGVEYSEWYEAHYVDTDFNTLGDHVSIGNTDTRSGGTFENFEAVIDAKNTTDFLASGHGALTQVYVLDTFDLQGSHIGDDDRKGEVIISVTNTHLGVISNYKENTDGTYTNYVEYLDDVMTTDTTSNTKVGLEYKSTDYQIITTDTFFDIGEVVSVKASGDDLIAAVDDSATLTTAAGVQADMSAIMINEPLTATGVVNQLDRYVYETGGVWLTLEGDDTDYYFNVANRGNVIDRGEMVPSLGANVKLYLEEFEGHKTILGYEIIEPESKYLYVEGVPTQGASYFVGVETKVTFDFGTEDNVYVTHVDGDAVTTSNVEDKIPSDNRLIDANGSIATANENFVVDDYNIVDETEFSQRIFRYEPYESNGQTFYKLYSLTNITENKANATYNSDEFDYDSNVMVNGKISTNEDIYYNIGNGINGTVGIFTSARYGDGIIDKSYDDKFAMSTVSVDNAGKTSFTNEDYIMLQGAAGETTAYGQTGEYGYGDARTGFNIIQGYGVYVLDMNPASDTKETLGYDGLFTGTYLQEGDATSGFVNVLKTDGTDSGFRIDEDHWTNNSANRDFAFLCDESTVFIDVVGGSATPATLAEVETLDSSDVNMQVIFGANGYADIVFINHGTNAEDISDPLDYFILKDGDGTVRTYNDDEGNQVHVYKVYVGGKETEMHLSSAAVATLGDNGLETNVLYYSVDTTGNDEIVDEVYFVVDYEPLRKVAYDINDIGQTGLDTLRADGTMSDATLALAYNNQWSVVTKQSTGTFTLSWKDTELYKGVGNTETTWADRTFTYDSETVFVAVTYGSGGLITDIRPTSSAALTVYSETNKNYPWVDVVSVKTNEYQKASLVTLLYPYDDGSSVESETDAAGIWFPEVPSTDKGAVHISYANPDGTEITTLEAAALIGSYLADNDVDVQAGTLVASGDVATWAALGVTTVVGDYVWKTTKNNIVTYYVFKSATLVEKDAVPFTYNLSGTTYKAYGVEGATIAYTNNDTTNSLFVGTLNLKFNTATLNNLIIVRADGEVVYQDSKSTSEFKLESGDVLYANYETIVVPEGKSLKLDAGSLADAIALSFVISGTEIASDLDDSETTDTYYYARDAEVKVVVDVLDKKVPLYGSNDSSILNNTIDFGVAFKGKEAAAVLDFGTNDVQAIVDNTDVNPGDNLYFVDFDVTFDVNGTDPLHLTDIGAKFYETKTVYFEDGVLVATDYTTVGGVINDGEYSEYEVIGVGSSVYTLANAKASKTAMSYGLELDTRYAKVEAQAYNSGDGADAMTGKLTYSPSGLQQVGTSYYATVGDTVTYTFEATTDIKAGTTLALAFAGEIDKVTASVNNGSLSTDGNAKVYTLTNKLSKGNTIVFTVTSDETQEGANVPVVTGISSLTPSQTLNK